MERLAAELDATQPQEGNSRRAEVALRRVRYLQIVGETPAALLTAQAALGWARAAGDVVGEAEAHLKWGQVLMSRPTMRPGVLIWRRLWPWHAIRRCPRAPERGGGGEQPVCTGLPYRSSGTCGSSRVSMGIRLCVRIARSAIGAAKSGYSTALAPTVAIEVITSATVHTMSRPSACAAR